MVILKITLKATTLRNRLRSSRRRSHLGSSRSDSSGSSERLGSSLVPLTDRHVIYLSGEMGFYSGLMGFIVVFHGIL